MANDNYRNMRQNAIHHTRQLKSESGESEVQNNGIKYDKKSIENNNQNNSNASENTDFFQKIKKYFNNPGLKMDRDTFIILMFIWILYKNGADFKLLAALAYIIL